MASSVATAQNNNDGDKTTTSSLSQPTRQVQADTGSIESDCAARSSPAQEVDLNTVVESLDYKRVRHSKYVKKLMTCFSKEQVSKLTALATHPRASSLADDALHGV